jgi:CRISPR-associated exonuclease Cas4
LVIGLIFFFISIILIYLSIKFKQKAKKLKINNKIQDGKIIYTDLDIPEKPFFSKRYKISGKPDYIIKKNGYYIPVEVKSGNHLNPKKSHIYQLIAYCQLLEDNYNCFIPYGIIVYYDTSKQFKIPYDPKMRFKLESQIKEMRKFLNYNKIQRNHFEEKKCIKCSMREYCNQKIN